MTGNTYYVFRQVNQNPWERLGPFTRDFAESYTRELRMGQDPKEVKVEVFELKPGETLPNSPYGE